MMSIGDREGRMFLSHPHTNDGFFFLLTTFNISFILEKLEKDFQEILNKLRCDMVTSFQHYNDVTDRCAASMRLSVFYLCLGLVRVCEIEISHMGKNNGNPDLVCEKQIC